MKNTQYYISMVTAWKNPASKLTQIEQEELYLAAKDIYYDEEIDPIMTDGEFDLLESNLKKLGSTVIQLVGGGAVVGKLKHQHMSPMLSLDKIQVNDENNFPLGTILDFIQTNFPIEATPKFDGSAIELNYENGKLKQALTRGKNGKGSDVTLKMSLIVPTTISIKQRVEIRGEILMTKDMYLSKYSHMTLPRAVVAGIINSDDTTNMKDLVYVAYSMKIHEGNDFHFPKNTQETLTSLGFNLKYPVKTTIITDAKQIRSVYDDFKHYREKVSPFFLDGIVMKMNEKYRHDLGDTNHHPRWAVAVKFPSEIAHTTITDIEWSVGYIGAVTPVGILKPVKLDGSTIQRVSLYNVGSIAKAGMFPGAEVSIKKSGDIIPQIIAIDKTSPNQDSYLKNGYFPHNCPSCNSVLRIEFNKLDGITPESLWCDNDNCLTKLSKKLCNGIDALELKGIGEAKAESLVRAGVTTIFDFFNPAKMNKTALIKSGQFSEGRELDIVLSIPLSFKETEFSNVIRSLQFPNLGRTGAKFVAKMLLDKNGFNGDFNGLEKAVILPFTDKASNERTLVRELVNLLRTKGVTINVPKDNSHLIGMELTGSPSGSGFDKKDDFVKFMQTKGFYHVGMKEAKILVTDDLKSKSSKMTTATNKKMLIVTYDDIAKNYDSIIAKIAK